MLISVEQSELDALADAMVAADRIFVSGWGRAGNNIKVLAMDCSQIGLRAHIVGDNTCPSMHEGDLFIIGSGSGETKSMVLFANQAKSHGVKIALLVGKRGSTLEGLADYTVHILDHVMIGSGYRPDAQALPELSALVPAAPRALAQIARRSPEITAMWNKKEGLSPLFYFAFFGRAFPAAIGKRYPHKWAHTLST